MELPVDAELLVEFELLDEDDVDVADELADDDELLESAELLDAELPPDPDELGEVISDEQATMAKGGRSPATKTTKKGFLVIASMER